MASRSERVGIYYQLPTFFVSMALIIYPLLYVIYLSFNELNLYVSMDTVFVGINNYRMLLSDEHFVEALTNSFIFVLGSTPMHFLLSLAFALIANEEFKGRSLYRGIMFAPWVMPIVVASVIWRWMLHPDWGIYNNIFRLLGLLGGTQTIGWLTDSNLVWLGVCYVNWIKNYPFMFVNILAALSSVPVELYEAAKIDGANAISRFRYITLPTIKPVCYLMLLLGVINTFINFEVIWLLTEGGPGWATTTYGIYVYILSFQEWKLGYGAAFGIVGLIVSLIFALLYIKYFMELAKK